MPADATTFFLGFAAVFGALGWYLWHLERKVDDVCRRVEALAVRAPEPPGRHAAATAASADKAASAATAAAPHEAPAQGSARRASGGQRPTGPEDEPAAATQKRGEEDDGP